MDDLTTLVHDHVSIDGTRVAYLDEGTGPVILLLHGAPLTSLGFARVISRLKTSHRVLAPDFPGFGASPPHPRFTGSLDGYARFVTAFVDTMGLDDFVAYLNDSSGCIGLAGLAPLADRLKGLVVADTVPIPMTGRLRLVKFVLRSVIASRPARWANRRFNLLPRAVATVAPRRRPFTAADRKRLVAQFDTHEKRDRVLDVLREMGTNDDFMNKASVRAAAALRHTPVLLLYGQFDPMRLLGAIGRFKRMFPVHRVQIVPREEHFPILAAGAEVAAAIERWVEELDAAAAPAGLAVHALR